MMHLMINTFLLGKCFSNELGIFIQLTWKLIELKTFNQRNAFCAAVFNMHAYIIHPLILFFLIRIYLNNQNYIQSNSPFIFFFYFNILRFKQRANSAAPRILCVHFEHYQSIWRCYVFSWYQFYKRYNSGRCENKLSVRGTLCPLL